MAFKKGIRIFLLVAVLVFSSAFYQFKKINRDYKYARFNLGYNNWTATQLQFLSSSNTIDFIVDGNQEIKLKMWWEAIIGNVQISIYDEKNNKIFEVKKKRELNTKTLDLDNGKYRLEIKLNNFTGGIALGYENMIISKNLDTESFSILEGQPNKGFYWEYILYVPDNIKHNKLMVIPNNTGMVTDNYEVHIAKAKNLIKRKSEMAENLGISLLVPIFPRPEANSDIYTHSLDRNSIFTDIENLERLDNQLIAMVDDAKLLLSEKSITIDNKILMSGFSASGDFVDRFSFLHPELIEAAVSGASDTITPLANLRNENLIYPIGVYDYKEITGKEFDLNLISHIPRFIYKGSEDKGGWETSDISGKMVRYTWEEYYEKYEVPVLKEKVIMDENNSVEDKTLTDEDLQLIEFKAFEGRILLNRFDEISKIYSDAGIDKTIFKLYKGIGHTITNEMKQDEIEFFESILQKE